MGLAVHNNNCNEHTPKKVKSETVRLTRPGLWRAALPRSPPGSAQPRCRFPPPGGAVSSAPSSRWRADASHVTAADGRGRPCHRTSPRDLVAGKHNSEI